MITLTAPQKLTLGAIGAVVLSLSFEASTQAAVIFNNGTPDLKFTVESDFDLPIEAGDNFALNSSHTISKVTWSGAYVAKDNTYSSTPSSDNFSVRIFEILHEIPQTTPLAAFNNVSVDRTSTAFPGFTLFNYAFEPLQPFALKSGSYLLSVVNNTTNDPERSWFWASSAESGNDFGRATPNTSWFQDDNHIELSFAIEGDAIPDPPPSPSPAPPPPAKVPTPALLPGLIGFSLSLWRRRKTLA